MSVTANTLAGPEAQASWDSSIDQELHTWWTKTWGPDSDLWPLDRSQRKRRGDLVKKLVNVDRRNSEFIVTSYTQTPPGFWQMNGHFSRIRPEGESNALGQAILDALDASNTVPLRDVDASDETFAPVLQALGLKRYTQYMKDVASVSVEIGNDGVLKVTPMRNAGAREGFVEIVDRARALSDRSAGSLTVAVQEAMTQTEG